MEAEAAKFIGAGLACLGMLGAAIGVGNIFGSFLQGAMRNPAPEKLRVELLFSTGNPARHNL